MKGAYGFSVPADSAIKLLDDLRQKVSALSAMVFLFPDMNTVQLVLVPTTDYAEAVIAFDTPEGQSMDCYELVRWLKTLEKEQPFEITHLAPDLLRARFLTEIKEPLQLAKRIEKICSDVVNEPIEKVARHLATSHELYLWWD